MASDRQTSTSHRRFLIDALLDAALECFDEAGYQGTSMAMIATRAGTTKPTLYDRIGSKEALFASVVARATQTLERALISAYEDSVELPLHEATALSTRPLFDMAREDPRSFRLLFGQIDGAPVQDAGDVALEVARPHVATLLLRWTAHRGLQLDPAEADLHAAMSVGCVRHAVLYAAATPGVTLDHAEERVVGFLLAALRHLSTAPA